ncbi:MAG: C40 family peptidase [Moraxella sp.]|nr:C40 family peptidase [Moraxella sp.]
MRLTKQLKSAIHAHAKSVYPNECCGLIVNATYYPCDNIAANPADSFEIAPADFVNLSELGEVQAIVHSHPNGNAEPSEIDRVQMGLHGVDWVICGFGIHADGEEYCDIKRHKPAAYTAPLIGREYHHGTQDCYSLVRDYYQRELGIGLNDYPRADAWWEDKDSDSLYLSNFKKEGFVPVPMDKLQKHDVLICRVGRTHHPNHALIYMADGRLQSEPNTDVVGSPLILHHPYGELSRQELFGDSWQRRVVLVLRHQSLG